MESETKTLVIGALGQVGSELTEALRKRFGVDNIIASDIRKPETSEGPFEVLDVMDDARLRAIVKQYNIKKVYNLAALLSATAEKNPAFAWELNMTGHFNVLNLAKEGIIDRIFWPSSIAVFGPTTPKENTPQDCVMDPNTVYGISKQAGERWNQYYFDKYNVDVRSVRYPGLVGYKTLPGGGTTDYAVDIFHQAIKTGKFECFLSEDTMLPMIYSGDAIKATIDIMEAPSEEIRIRSSYNLAGMSFTPADLAEEIKALIPNFEITYKPDFRQEIANSWPGSIDDSKAKQDWNWKPNYDTKGLVKLMIEQLKQMQEA